MSGTFSQDFISGSVGSMRDFDQIAVDGVGYFKIVAHTSEVSRHSSRIKLAFAAIGREFGQGLVLPF